MFLFQRGKETGPIILNGDENLIKEVKQSYEFKKKVAEYISSLSDENGFDVSKNDVKSPSIRTTYLGADILDKIRFGKYNKKKIASMLEQSYNNGGFYKTADADNPIQETFFAVKLSKLLGIGINPKVNLWIRERLNEKQSDENYYYLYCSLKETGKLDKSLVNDYLKSLKVISKTQGIEVDDSKSKFNWLKRLGLILNKDVTNLTKATQKEDYYLEGDATNERLYFAWKALKCLDADNLDRSLLCLKYRQIDIATSRTLDSLYTRLSLIEEFCGKKYDVDKKLLTLSRFYNPDSGSFFIKRGEHNSIYPTYLGIDLLDKIGLLE